MEMGFKRLSLVSDQERPNWKLYKQQLKKEFPRTRLLFASGLKPTISFFLLLFTTGPERRYQNNKRVREGGGKII